jgi:hypothetical protein
MVVVVVIVIVVVSLCVDAEAGDLREICCRGEVEHVHVVKNVVSVKPAKDEEPRICEERGMVSTLRRSASEGRPRLILQRYWKSQDSKPEVVGGKKTAIRLTEIKEEQFRGIFRAVMSTGNEKIGTDLRG